jgi:hypothetical protein
MATYTDIDSFFCMGVAVLNDNYYILHNERCDICQEENDDVPLTASGSSIASTPIIKINSCGHIFHKPCLQTWLISTRSKLHDATCPMCRALLVTAPHPSLEIDHLANELRESHRLLIELLNSLLPITVDEAYEYAKQLVALAATLDERMGVTTLSESVAGMVAYIDEYEALQAARSNAGGVGAWMRRMWQKLPRRDIGLPRKASLR